jgi:hypothetical protein
MEHNCSFCGGNNHTIRLCDSPSIPILEQNMAHYYYSVLQQSVRFGLNDEETEAFFVSDINEKCTFRELRVLAVTSAGAATSGINKAGYTTILYAYYKQVLDNIVIRFQYTFNDLVRNLMTDFDDAFANANANANANSLEKKFDIVPCLNPNSLAEITDDIECCICMREEVKKKDFVKLNCGHQFCGECVTKTLESSENKAVACALCRSCITQIDVTTSECFDMVSKYCKISDLKSE